MFRKHYKSKKGGSKPLNKTPKSRFTPWKTLIITAAVMIGLYSGFNFLISTSTTSLQTNLQKIAHEK